MTYVRSFTHIERALMHHYRDLLNRAESEEDIKKFFTRTARRLLVEAMGERMAIEEDDAVLDPRESPFYRVSDRLSRNKAYQELRRHSDLESVLARFARPAVKHYQHIVGHPEKTEAKIRHH